VLLAVSRTDGPIANLLLFGQLARKRAARQDAALATELVDERCANRFCYGRSHQHCELIASRPD